MPSLDTLGMIVAVVTLCGLGISSMLSSFSPPPPPPPPPSSRSGSVNVATKNFSSTCGFDPADLPSEIFWAAPFYSGGGYCSEARDAANGLESCGVNVWRLQHGDSYNRAFSERLGTQRLHALQSRTVRGLPTSIKLDQRGQPSTICVCHSEPGAWSAPRPNYRTGDCPTRGCSYTIGRTMFETDRIPDGWAERLNYMDEIWVPTEFQRKIFANNGVEFSKLHVVGETVDSQFFNPALAEPYVIPQRLMKQPAATRLAGSPPLTDSTTVFFSVFKWEDRKAPDILIDAYCRAFSSNDDVLLLILTGAYHSDSAHGNRIAKQRKRIAKTLGQDPETLPAIAVLDENVPQEDMPKLYKRAQAFVLPSRGEGWGRPHMEALSMGIPVLATNWSGPTAFLHEGNSYPIPIAEKLVPVANGPFQGHLWADPLVDELKSLFRRVLNGSVECQAKNKAMKSGSPNLSNWEEKWPICGELFHKRKRARQDVLELWSLDQITIQMLKRLAAIQKSYLPSLSGKEL